MRRCIGLRAAHHAQHVAAGDLFKIGLRVTPPRQFGEQCRIFRRHPPCLASPRPCRRNRRRCRHDRRRCAWRYGRCGQQAAPRSRAGRDWLPATQSEPVLAASGSPVWIASSRAFSAAAPRRPAAHLLADIAWQRHHHDDPAIGLEPVEHAVGHIAGMAIDRACAEWLNITGALATSNASSMVFLADVAEIDQHAEPLHLAHDVAAEVESGHRAPGHRWRYRPSRCS